MVAPPPIVAPQDDEAGFAESATSPAQARATSKRDALSMLAEGKTTGDANTRSGRRDTMLAQADITASPVMSAPAAPAAAPPPPPMKAESSVPAERREELAVSRDVIVTAMRRRGRAVPERGDWNACTINDPKRSLAACKSLVNSGAKGSKGQAAAHLADGLSLAWQGNIDRAIVAFDQAIAINPKSSLAYLNRGLAWRQKGDGNRALTDLDQAVKLAPNTARGYYNRGLLQRERGDDRRAKADQTRAIDLDANYEAVID
jgi:tetratricopeptide (TPR) repeat protein